MDDDIVRVDIDINERRDTKSLLVVKPIHLDISVHRGRIISKRIHDSKSSFLTTPSAINTFCERYVKELGVKNVHTSGDGKSGSNIRVCFLSVFVQPTHTVIQILNRVQFELGK